MATRRTTHDKRQRERNKQQKAAAKRARRQGEAVEGDPEIETTEIDDGPESTEQLLQEMETLHATYDAGQLEFEDFEEQKSTLMDRIAVRLAE